MKRTFTSLPFWMLILIGFTCIAQKKDKAQKDRFKFGNVTVQDLEEIPEGDSTASAVVLFDIGKCYFQTSVNDIQLVFERHTKIKILSKAGYQWADGSIGIYQKSGNAEYITNFHAATYNLEFGKVVSSELKKDGIFDDKVVDFYLYKKFAMPDVKEGSIIEYKYKIYSPYIFNLRPWTFQRSIPVKYSEYEFEIPEFFHFKKEMKGYEDIKTSVKRTSKTYFTGVSSSVDLYNMVGENLPAFQEEAYLTCAEDYQASIDFEISTILPPGRIPIKLITDWAQIGRDLMEYEYFGTILEKKGAVRSRVDSLTLNAKDDLEKVKSIYDYIRKNIKWNENKGIYASHYIRKTLEDKSGNAADINLLLTLMLKTAGLAADPVILSTRDHGIVLPFFAPILSKFNYVICQVKIGEKTLLIDATDFWRPYNVLPLRCLNGIGRVFNEKSSEWVTLRNNENSFAYNSLNFVLNEDGSLEGKINLSSKNYLAFKSRQTVGRLSYEDYVEEMKKKKEAWEIKNLVVENLDKLEEPFIEKYEVKINNLANSAGDKIYLDPFLLSKIIENPFKMEERKYPVDYGYPITDIYHCTIKLPQGYTLEEPIKPMIVNLPEKSGRFTYEVSESGGILQVKTNFVISKTQFLPEEYSTLKAFYNHVIAKQAEQIVLKKL